MRYRVTVSTSSGYLISTSVHHSIALVQVQRALLSLSSSSSSLPALKASIQPWEQGTGNSAARRPELAWQNRMKRLRSVSLTTKQGDAAALQPSGGLCSTAASYRIARCNTCTAQWPLQHVHVPTTAAYRGTLYIPCILQNWAKPRREGNELTQARQGQCRRHSSYC